MLLLGSPLPAELRPTTIDAVTFGAADLPPGLPSEVLLTRPDIRAAEHSLRASNADIGAARAAFFPSVTISCFAGETDSRFENLFTGVSNEIWTFTPQVNLPIFHSGRLRAQLGVANHRSRHRRGAIRALDPSGVPRSGPTPSRFAARLVRELEARQSLADAAQSGFQLSKRAIARVWTII